MRPSDKPLSAFGVRLEQWLDEHLTATGRRVYTQGDIAEAVGVTRSAVSGWKLGPSVPTMDNLHSLSEFTGISFDELVALVENQVAHRRGVKTRSAALEAQAAAGEESQDLGGEA